MSKSEREKGTEKADSKTDKSLFVCFTCNKNS